MRKWVIVLITVFLLLTLSCGESFEELSGNKKEKILARAEKLGIEPNIALQVNHHNELRKITFTPKTKAELIKEIKNRINKLNNRANLNYIDVSNITDFEKLFDYTNGMIGSFNGTISQWNTKNVTNMSHMFYNQLNFNGYIEGWDTSKVEDMSHMFDGANEFNRDIGRWDVSNVKDMKEMFYFADKFNQNLENWKVAASTDMFDFSGVDGKGVGKPSWCTSVRKC